MKKKNIINLIKFHTEKNEIAFRNEAIEIAKYFENIGDHQLSSYVIGLLADANVFIPQNGNFSSDFMKLLEFNNEPLPLPTAISSDIRGIINAISHNAGINKFLFEGAPGTGKTETVKQISRIIERDLFIVEISELIDSKLGQTAKNIVAIFNDINRIPNPSKAIILFDELDALALDRINTNDLREMGRATSTLLKELDNLNQDVVLIATTNLFNKFDKALIRRFDAIVNFNRYTKEDLIDIAEVLFNSFQKKFKTIGRNIKMFRKILSIPKELPYPAELKNIIKTAIAFSDPDSEFDYLRRLMMALCGLESISTKDLRFQGFTVREIEIITGVSKSQVSRNTKEEIL